MTLTSHLHPPDLARATRSGTILASNTMSCSITEIAQGNHAADVRGDSQPIVGWPLFTPHPTPSASSACGSCTPCC